MRKASRRVVFIKTSTPSEIINVLKPLSDVKEMDDEVWWLWIIWLKDTQSAQLVLDTLHLQTALSGMILIQNHTFNRQSKEVDTDSLLLETANNAWQTILFLI